MNLKQFYLVNNECYKVGRKLTVSVLMLHSTGANNKKISRYVPLEVTNSNHWNVNRPGGRQVCVHGFIGELEDGTIATVQTLPWDMQGWHAGGSANSTAIGVEICEDNLQDANYFNKVYTEAVELFAYLCERFHLNPLTQIICHSEGYKKGVASNHADVMHWFPKHGKSMDTFRADVKAKMNNTTKVEEPTEVKKEETTTATNYLVKINTATLNVREGAGTNYKVTTTVKKDEVYTIVEEKMNGTTKWGKLKSGSGWISLGYTTKVNQKATQTVNTKSYYPIPNYKGSSVVDALNSIGVDSSFNNRKKIAAKNNIRNYSGSAVQNRQMLDKLMAGKLIKV